MTNDAGDLEAALRLAYYVRSLRDSGLLDDLEPGVLASLDRQLKAAGAERLVGP